MQKLIATGLIALNIFLSPTMTVRAQEVRKQDCTAAIANAQKRIETGRSVEVIVRSSEISQEYPDHPADRLYQYKLLLQGNASESIMNSPQFMKLIAEPIINNCNTVGLVTFAVYQSGWNLSIGLMPEGKIDF